MMKKRLKDEGERGEEEVGEVPGGVIEGNG